MVLEPETPPVVAVMVEVPSPTPVTTPVAETVATEGADDVQARLTPEATFPLPSRTTAAPCDSFPIPTTGDDRDTVTLDTEGAVTVRVAEPDWPSLVAVMSAEPGPMAVTTPLEFTVATAPLLVLQENARPVSGVPPESRATADAWVVWPTVRLFVPSVTETLATGGAVSTVAST